MSYFYSSWLLYYRLFFNPSFFNSFFAFWEHTVKDTITVDTLITVDSSCMLWLRVYLHLLTFIWSGKSIKERFPLEPDTWSLLLDWGKPTPERGEAPHRKDGWDSNQNLPWLALSSRQLIPSELNRETHPVSFTSRRLAHVDSVFLSNSYELLTKSYTL